MVTGEHWPDLVDTPLRFAGNAITVTIDFHARAVFQIKHSLFAGVHLSAAMLSLALKPWSAVALCRGLATTEMLDVTRFLVEMLPPVESDTCHNNHGNNLT
jgi:hypothetical protein